MNVNPAVFTVPQLREQIAVLDPQRPTSKLRKAELVALLISLQEDQVRAVDQDSTLEDVEVADHERTVAEQLTRTAGEPQVFQGAMHSYGPEDMAIEFGDLAASATQAAKALSDMVPPIQSAAKAIGRVAYGHLRATVRSMGRTVYGRVVDTVVRTPDRTGGRVLLVVQHEGHATRRTLHRLTDVKFDELTS
jgi:hypothetical protein